jgi:predicted nucleic acid-binding Zn ribbon protein
VSRFAPRPVSDALSGLTAQLAPATALARVQAVWAQAAGEAIAAEAQPVSERDGTVTVACRSAVWAHELELMAPELVERVNRCAGADLVGALKVRAGGWG